MVTTGINTVGTGEALDGSLNSIISDFRVRTQAEPVIRPTAEKMTLRAHAGRGINVVEYGRVTAYALADAVDMVQAQLLQDTTTSWTPEEVGVQVILSGSALRRSADPSLESKTSKMMSNALILKEDTAGAAQFAAFTGTLGAAGTVISPGHVEAAASRLALGNNRTLPEPVAKPWFAVLHPYQATVLRGRIIPYATTPEGGTAYGVNTGAHLGVSVAGAGTAFQERLMINGPGSLGKFAGFNVRESANIAVDANDDAVAGFYGFGQLVFVDEVPARVDPDRSDKSMRGAVELNAWAAYTYGVYRPDLAIAGTFDASTPTS